MRPTASPPLALLLLAAAAVPCVVPEASAQRGVPASPEAASRATTGRVAGRVTDAATGEALSGATVLVEGRGRAAGRGATAGFDGAFEVVGLPPGEVRLRVTLLGYAPQSVVATVRPGEAARLDVALAEQPFSLADVLVQADAPTSAASSQAVRDFDLVTRPVRSSQDLLRLAPGLVTAQHAGGGKAEQIFLRGFDADHGTDVAISVDGMPVNLVSHGHGQGYADLHFVIADVVETVDVYKGPYNPANGNFATAGAVGLVTRDHLDENIVRVEAGQFNTVGVTALVQVPMPTEHQGAYVAGQFTGSDGPFQSPQGFRRVNVFGKLHTHLGASARLAVSASGFASAWDASGQVPQRAIDSGQIGRFGAIDDVEGGTTARQDLNLRLDAGTGTRRLAVQAFASRYDFKLFSNFTFFLVDPVRGDMIEQTDRRTLAGLNARYAVTAALGPFVGTTTIAGGFRADDAAVSLWQSPDRVRLAPLVRADLAERNFYLWAEEDVALTPRVRLLLGLRGDVFTYNVDDALEGTGTDLPRASGFAQQALVSPKASLVVRASDRLDLFANAGTGFHSNDARDVVIGARVSDIARRITRTGGSDADVEAELVARGFDPAQRGSRTLPRAVGAELGLRARPFGRASLGAALRALDLESEFVYVGDGGATEPSGRTRRVGVDLDARASLLSWLAADADVSVSRGRFRDAPAGEDAVPLAPRVTATGGLTARQGSRLEGALRVVHIGDRPANEAGSVTAQGYTLVGLSASYRIGAVRLSAIAENLLDVAWNEAQFDTESRLPGESAPVSELHFTPGNPRNLRLGLSYAF